MGRESGACFRVETAGSRISVSSGQSRVPFRYAFRMKSNRLLHVSLQSYVTVRGNASKGEPSA